MPSEEPAPTTVNRTSDDSSGLMLRLAEAEARLRDPEAAGPHRPDALADLLRDVGAALARGGGACCRHGPPGADPDERRRVESKLRSTERLHLALAAGRMIAWELDLASNRVTMSGNSLETLGVAPGEYDLEAFAARVHPSDAELVRSAFTAPTGLAAPPETRLRMTHATTGEPVWFERRGEVVRYAGDRVVGLNGVLLDIRERVRADEIRARSQELELQNRRIQEANRLKSEYLSNMSHELRTPLNAIIGFAELLFDGHVEPGSPQHEEFLGDILASGKHLLRLINDVLDLSKVDAGRLEFHPERTHIPRVISEVCTLLRTTASQRRIRVTVEGDPGMAEVTIDATRLRQVLYNYLSNALKFTPEGGSVVVRTLAESDESFRLEVEDNGVGVAPADLGRLFVEFQQLESGAAKAHAGTGLGLALTRRLVEAQGGYVGVRSVLGEGSVFYAVLPRCAQGPAPARWTPTPRALRHGARSILVVDDEPRERALLERVLGDAGYAVDVAATGAEAVARCRDRIYDAVTLDLLLPDMSGLELLASIRADGRNRGAAVIVATAVPDDSALAGVPVHDVLRKPIEPPALLASLERANVRPDRRGGVLVVDDDPRALSIMETALVQLGHHAVCRLSGQSGLAALDRFAPVAVVLDLRMPEIDGAEFLRRLRANPEHHRTPVMIWTAMDLAPDEAARLRSSAQAVVSKRASGVGAGLLAELRAFLRIHPSQHPPLTQHGR